MAAAAFGVLMTLLVKLGNPGNMGFCGNCFLRDIAGALGLHSAVKPSYPRPEVMGLILGAFASAIFFKEFRPAGGSAPLVRFVLGILISVGALVFLGCPLRMTERLAGGDLNALLGLAGFVLGISIGVLLVRKGYNPGREVSYTSKIIGGILPATALFFLIAAYLKMPGIRFSTEKPGTIHAAFLISTGAGLVAGFLFHRIRYCTLASVKDSLFFGDNKMLYLVLAVLGSCMITNMLTGNFKLGFAGQPLAHTNYLWNFAGMILVGLACSLAGGCPTRHLALSGQGNSDSAIVVIGMLAGAALSHNFHWASTGKGIAPAAPVVIIAGIVLCLIIGLGLREKMESIE
ncbi:YedE family putative selenium transporter [Planctomycetota bacterium]